MKQKVLLITFILMTLVVSQNVKAYDFSYTYNGKTLYYNIIGGNAEVTYMSLPPATNNYISGNIIIPSNVIYNGNSYSVTSIGSYAFDSCVNLASVIIPNSVISIGNLAFSGCYNLTSVIIPNSVTTIGNWAFEGCGFSSITIPNSVVSIGTGAFSNCDNLITLTIPNSITTINDNSFSNCNSLISVSIPNTITSIGNSSFANCGNMTSIIIPGAVTSIGNDAFWYCSSLTEIISFASIAPTLGNYTFWGVPSSTIIQIPCGNVTSYASTWSYFSNFAETGFYSINAISADITMGQVSVLTIPTCQNPTALIYASAEPNHQFVGWSDANTENPRAITLTSDTSIIGYFFAQSDSVPDTIIIHDTSYVFLFDTINVPIHDTSYINVYDTTYIIVHDTTYIPVHDTTTAVDTIYIIQTDTLLLTIHDTIYLPQYIYDTIYIHDTIIAGVDEVDAIDANIYTCNGQIVVEGANGNNVCLYNVNGRLLATKQDEFLPLHFDVPASGAYLVKIGNHLVRKVVGIR